MVTVVSVEKCNQWTGMDDNHPAWPSSLFITCAATKVSMSNKPPVPYLAPIWAA